MSAPDDNTNFERADAEARWRDRSGYRAHLTKKQIDNLLRYGHPIPVGRGLTRKYVEKNHPGWTWNDLIAVFKAASVLDRSHTMLRCHAEVQEIHGDDAWDWVVLWRDGRVTCAGGAPRVGGGPEGNQAPERTAVEVARARPPRITLKDLLPWDVAEQHRKTEQMKMFQVVLDERNDDHVSGPREALLKTWQNDLDELNLVVAYDPDCGPNAASFEGGFHYVPRRPEDTWIIRDPELD